MSEDSPSYREIERRFLVMDVPGDLVIASESQLEQGYIVLKPVVRLRKSGQTCFLTIKRGPMEDHEEREIILAPEQFAVFWPMTEGHRIRKTRMCIPYLDYVIELDFFHGPHEGLKIAEVEFLNQKIAKTFEPPAWFGEEITGRAEYSNARLACE